MFKTIVPEIARTAPDSIRLVVTNPVDVLTYAALRFSGFEPGRVIGSGTVLDSARFRYLIAERCGVDVRNVHAHIIGEHGDTELPVWSSANIGGVRFNQYCAVCGEGCDFRREFEPVFEEVRTSAYKIIAAKGATYYAIATALVKITSAILRNENSVLSVSRLIDGYLGIRDVCIGIPSIVNKAGATKQLELDLSTEEREAFIHSARMIRQAIDDLGIERATAGAGAQRTK
jgi:L-lactate dehydrogenase